jgi:hypothetical protein
MENSNYHLRGSFAALSSVNLIQQAEINRLAKQIQGMAGQFNSQVGGFQKGEAMYDALHHTYDNELARVSHQYDVEVEALQKQVHDKEQMISSLESSLDSMDGVVVRADSVANPGAVSNALVASVNADFQFIIIDAGVLKGVKLGQMIEISHAGAVIGYGQIEKIYPDFSGAKVFSDDAITRIKKGDSVVLRRLPAF